MLFGFSRIQCRHIPGFQRGVLPDGLPDSLRASGKGLHRYARHFPHTVLTDHFSFIAQRLNLLFQFFPVEPAKGNLISVHILNEPRFPHFVTAQCLPLTVMLRDISYHRMRV